MILLDGTSLTLGDLVAVSYTHLFAHIGLLNHFFNQGRLSSSQKAGININFCHFMHLLYQ